MEYINIRNVDTDEILFSGIECKIAAIEILKIFLDSGLLLYLEIIKK